MKNTAQKWAKILYKNLDGDEMAKRFIDQLDKVLFIFNREPALPSYLETGSIPTRERKQQVDKLFRDSLDERVLDTIKLLIEENSLRLLDEILNQLKTERKRIMNLTTAEVQTSRELGSGEKKMIERLIKEKSPQNVEIDYEVNPSLIGGIKILMGKNVLMDASVATKLTSLKRKLSQV